MYKRQNNILFQFESMVINIDTLCYVRVLFWHYSPYSFNAAEERGPTVWNSLKKSRNLLLEVLLLIIIIGYGSKLNVDSGEMKSRPCLHRSEQIFTWTKTCTVPPCVYMGPSGTGQIFERLL